MKKYFTGNNLPIMLGVVLPAFLAVVFWLSATLPAKLVAPPQHDYLFYVQRYDRLDGVAMQLEVVDGRLQLKLRAPLKTPPTHPIANPMRIELYRYHAATDSTTPYPLSIPDVFSVPPGEWQAHTIPGADKLMVDASSRAPDGYEFTLRSGGRSGGLFGELLYDRVEKAGIRHRGRFIPLPDAVAPYDGSVRFVGWVVETGPRP
jgi:hypothetical protein